MFLVGINVPSDHATKMIHIVINLFGWSGKAVSLVFLFISILNPKIALNMYSFAFRKYGSVEYPVLMSILSAVLNLPISIYCFVGVFAAMQLLVCIACARMYIMCFER